ncbi:regulator of arylsulfatase activity [gut metagenome]|uniref:Regulator of arylsulfatase activity n=1 Tax=gut metagenome TaxID=749906 RepID=J9GLS0_9ZZZZ
MRDLSDNAKPQATASPFAHPVYVMAKPAGALCNLACTYCYYTEKSKLYQQQPRHVMDDALLEQFVKEYIAMQTTPTVLFTWHGGEPLMRPIAFYERVLELQQKYAEGKVIDNSIQTNGTLITEDWARFFKKHNFLVGLSIDGPQEFHNEYRKTRTGKDTWHQVMKGIRLLDRHGVEWNAMAVVNDFIADYPLDFYHFFKEIGCHYIQFTPVVERFYRHPDGRLLASPIDGAIAELTDFSVTPEQWGDFLCAVFDEWVKNDVGDYFIQMFDSTLAGWMGVAPSLCCMAETCGHAGVMEFNGDVYACDHFVFPEFKLGNIKDKRLMEMMYSKEQLQFGMNKRDLLTAQCRDCEFLFACHGECPRNRFATSVAGERGHNYLCKGYYRFFRHVAPYMDYMKWCLQHKEAPAKVMDWIRDGMPSYRK